MIWPILQEYKNSLVGGYADDSLTMKFLGQTFDRVKDWDRGASP